jgi:predicted Zn finger-like uncharacterized protein
MLIICPDCLTSYEVEPTDVGAGRKVRCSACGAEWRAEGDPDFVPRREMAARLEAMAEPQEDDDADFAPIGASGEIEDVAAEDDKPARKRRRKGRGTSPRAIAKPKLMPMLAAAGIAALAALGIWREAIVSLVPDLAGLYAAVGLPVNLRGLEFRAMNTVETMEGGVPLLVVRGTIANITDTDVDVPRLRLAVRAASGREIFVWTAMPEQKALKAGDSAPFFAQLASPPAEGREVAIRFLGARDARRTVQ